MQTLDSPSMIVFEYGLFWLDFYYMKLKDFVLC
jgi:hypothetical protein